MEEGQEGDEDPAQARKMKQEELTKKREEAERKARRGEIDPTHEFTFHLIGQVGGEGV